jgi:hypothetical protein
VNHYPSFESLYLPTSATMTIKSSVWVFQYNHYKNNSLSPRWTKGWLQYKRYFNISDFKITDFFLQRKWEKEIGDLVSLQYKRYFKLSDFNISGVSCISFEFFVRQSDLAVYAVFLTVSQTPPTTTLSCKLLACAGRATDMQRKSSMLSLCASMLRENILSVMSLSLSFFYFDVLHPCPFNTNWIILIN